MSQKVDKYKMRQFIKRLKSGPPEVTVGVWVTPRERKILLRYFEKSNKKVPKKA